jgi:hypothetical protein
LTIHFEFVCAVADQLTRKFIVFIGPIRSIFDYATYAMNPTRPCTLRRKTSSISPTDEDEQILGPGGTIQNACLLSEWV